MITLFELAEYNAAKKNKTRSISKTHKDVEAFLMVKDYYFVVYNCVNIVIIPKYFKDFLI